MFIFLCDARDFNVYRRNYALKWGRHQGGLVKKKKRFAFELFNIYILIRDNCKSFLFILKLLSVLSSSVFKLERLIKGVLILSLKVFN